MTTSTVKGVTQEIKPQEIITDSAALQSFLASFSS